MIQIPIYRWSSIIFLLTLALTAIGDPQVGGSYGPNILPDDPINWREYDGYFVLRPCLLSIFASQVAENVGCSTNSCLCDKQNLKSNMAMLSSQVPATCTDIRAVDIPHATSVLAGYCAEMETDGSANTEAATATPQITPAAPSTKAIKSANSLVPTALETRPSIATFTLSATEEEASSAATAVGPTTALDTPSTTGLGSPLIASPSHTPGSPNPPDVANTPTKEQGPGKGGMIAGIVVGVVVAVLAAFLLWMCIWGPCSKQKRGEESRYHAAARIVSFGKVPTEWTGRKPWEYHSPEMGFAPKFDAVHELEAPATPIFVGPHELESTPPTSPRRSAMPDNAQLSEPLNPRTRVDSAAVLHSPQF